MTSYFNDQLNIIATWLNMSVSLCLETFAKEFCSKHPMGFSEIFPKEGQTNFLFSKGVRSKDCCKKYKKSAENLTKN